jgi:ketosteroid isomerase-like protein
MIQSKNERGLAISKAFKENYGFTPVSSMTDEEMTNLETVLNWAEFYNTDVPRMVTECYSPDCKVEVVGSLCYHGHKPFIILEKAVHKIAPRRVASGERVIATGNVAVVQGVLVDPDMGEKWETRFCAVLTFKNGKIVLDQTYLDFTRWPSPVLSLKVMKELGIELYRPLGGMAAILISATVVRKATRVFNALRRKKK